MEVSKNIIHDCNELHFYYEDNEVADKFLYRLNGRKFYTIKPEIQVWLKENDIKFRINYANIGPYVALLFQDDDGVMAFKLRWI